jgi:hypothetical protein
MFCLSLLLEWQVGAVVTEGAVRIMQMKAAVADLNHYSELAWTQNA